MVFVDVCLLQRVFYDVLVSLFSTVVLWFIMLIGLFRNCYKILSLLEASCETEACSLLLGADFKSLMT